ncbi:hypothetical protein KGF54_004290 [Candida jiufengensis]|uniref:uncharacterized protein n=1 Tax=Candida jiufengensis TaxID=497108 RepID=UPI00222582EF|nr:uncharacterized protein KGF54_004290 [Candida jiufengensis]KAI5951216.1 hypothetical protein KGF54_004290 [Candida jiufengensis]
MQFFTTLLVTVYCLILQVSAAPVEKRWLSPSSPTFSLIAIHKGSKFSSNLVKFNGTAVKLGSDDKAFFGTIEADKGYILNLPLTNGSNSSSPIDVVVSNSSHLVSTTTKNGSASEHFGIKDGWLSFLNSTQFLACPEIASSNKTSNSSSNSTGEYDLYSNPLNKTKCPSGKGYDVKLLVQLSIPISFSPEDNSSGFFKRNNIFKSLAQKLF